MKKVLLCFILLVGFRSLAVAQTTHDFSSEPTLIEYPGFPSWKYIAEVTIGGAVYQITTTGNGGWSHSATGGSGNGANILYSPAGTSTVTIKRKDNARFQFYGVWLKYTNSGSGYSPPWLTVSYPGSSLASETYGSNTQVTLASKNVNVTSVNLSFSGLLNLNFDDLIVGPAVASLATVTTSAASQVSGTTATLGGNVTSDGGGTITERGVVWATTSNPTTSNNKIAVGNGTGSFSTLVSGLTSNTTYYVRSYAINSVGTAYGTQISFTTTDGSGPVTINPIMDTSVDKDGAYGTETFLFTGFEDAYGTQETALKFNLPVLSGSIGSAKLRVYATQIVGSNAFLKAWGSNNDVWLENTATIPSKDVSLPQISATTARQWYEINVTSFVSSQYADDKVVTLVLTGSDVSAVYLYSRETASFKPELVITPAVGSNNANLSNLALSSGTLTPAFSSGTISYTASVANSVSSITVTPTVADATASVKVNGVAVSSGNASGAIALNVGANTITILVTAQDASTKTYTLTVTRAAALTSVTSIVRASSSPSNASTVNYTVTFGASVTGLDAGDFSLIKTGTATGTIGAPTGSGTTWTVPVSAITGDGTLRLDFVNPTGISPNTSANFTSGEVFTIDKTAPNTTITSQPAGFSSSGSATFTFSSSEGGTFEASLNGAAYTAASSPISYANVPEGVNSFSVRAIDAAGNVDATPATYNWVIDKTSPVVANVLVPSNSTYKTGSNLTFTVNFSEPLTVIGNPTLGITLNTGGLVNATYVSGSGTSSLTFAYTVMAGNADSDGISLAGSISLNGSSIADMVGNSATLTLQNVSLTTGVKVDAVPPTATISLSNTNLKAGQTATVTIAFSEAVTGFAGNDFTNISNGALGVVSSSDGGVTWTATFYADANVIDATNVLTLNMAQLTDLAGNPGVGTVSSGNYTVSTVRPTATIVLTDAALKADETSLVTITFSEAVSGFSNAYLTVANGSLSAVSSTDGGKTWTATFTPTANITDATNVISLNNTGVTNAAGNTGTGVTNSGNYAIDTARPTATIVVADGNLSIGETSLVTITFSEAVSGFSIADLTVQNGTLSDVSSSDGGITWTTTLTPAAGVSDVTNIIALANTGVADMAGNTGTGVTNSNNYAIDSAHPTATIVVADATLIAGETSLVTITFSEAVTGFTTADLTVANGTISSLSSSDGGVTWTATFTPTASITDVTNLIVLDNTGVADLVGNARSGTTSSNNYSVDTAPPSSPLNLSADRGDSQVVLTWNANSESDLKSYKVYGGTSANPGTLLQTVISPATSFTHTGLTNGTTYFYRISAIDNVGNESSPSADVSATPAAGQTITFSAPAVQTYGDADFNPGASSSSGLAVSYTSDNAAVATIVSGKIHITGAGTATITAVQTGNAAFTAATPVTQTLTVNKKALTVTADNKSKIYGEANPALTVTYNGLVNGETVLNPAPSVSTIAGQLSGVGTYDITASGTSPNYEITFVKGTLTVNKKALTVTAENKNKIYGEANPALTVTYNGLVNGETVLNPAPTISTVATAASTVGTYDITTSGTSPNYEITFVKGTLTVNKKALTVTAENKSKIYGQANPALTVSYNGLVNGETVLNPAPSVNTIADQLSGVGAYDITASGTSPNYEISFVKGTLTVNKKALTVTAENKSKIYGEANPVLTVSYNGLVNGETALSPAPSVSTVADQLSGVGTYDITASGTSPNYQISFVKGTLSVNKKALTVTAENKSKIYGESNPVLTVSYNGLVNGETALSPAPSVSTIADQSSVVGTYDITANGTAPNYDITFVKGTLTVNKKALTVTAENKSKIYGEVNPALTVTYNGLVNGETVLSPAPTISTIADQSSVVGTYDITANGTASNYDITFVKGALSVNKKALTVTAENKSKIYGEVNPALTVTYNGLVNGETVLNPAPSLSTLADQSSVVGTYDITANGTAPNYDITFVKGTLSVNKKALTVMAENKSKIYGEVNPVLTVTYDGLVNGETVLNPAPSLSTLADQSSVVGTYDITANGTAPNYDITFVKGTLSVNKKALTVMAENKSKIYGEVNPVLTVTYDGLVNGETVLSPVPLISTVATTASGVGTYDITASGTAPNYEISFVKGTLLVNKKALTVTAENKSKIYGESNPAFTVSYNGLVNGETELSPAPSFSTAANELSGIGTYDIIASGSSPNYTITFQKGSLTVNKKALTITADNKEKYQGLALPAFTASYNGFVNGETSAVLTTQPAFSTIANAMSPQGNYPIEVNGATAANYTITQVNGVLTVKPGYPTSISLAASTIYENSATGTLAGTLSSTSDDPTTTFKYELVAGSGDTDNALFEIADNQVKTKAVLNFENKPDYRIRVRSIAQNSMLFLDKEFTVSINNVNEQPTLNDIAAQVICYTTASQTLALSGISAGEDAGQSTVVSVSSTNNNLFEVLEVNQAINGTAELRYVISKNAFGTAVVNIMVMDNGGTANAGVNTILKSFVLKVNPLPVITIASNKGNTLSKGETAVLTAAGGTTYQWADANGIISGQSSAVLTVRPSASTTYKVTVTNALGCSEVQDFTINVNEDYLTINGTNLLTPNGDGVNDKFIIKNLDMYPGNELKIFDRAGRLLYGQKNYSDQWDGTLNGSPLAPDTYYYIVDFGPNKPKLKGFITIVRD